jgi:hypothetical protein
LLYFYFFHNLLCFSPLSHFRIYSLHFYPDSSHSYGESIWYYCHLAIFNVLLTKVSLSLLLLCYTIYSLITGTPYMLNFKELFQCLRIFFYSYVHTIFWPFLPPTSHPLSQLPLSPQTSSLSGRT